MRSPLTTDRPWTAAEHLWPKLYALALLVTTVLLTWRHTQPPLLGDLGDWAYQGALLARHLRGIPDPSHALKHYPVPNATVTVVLGLLMLVCSWSTALKLFVVMELSFGFLAIHCLARAAGSSPYVYIVAPGMIFLGVNFWFGFAAFQLGLALLMFVTVALVTKPACTVLTLSPLLLLLFFTHMVPYTFACLITLLVAAQQRRAQLLVALLPSAFCLGMYVLGRFLSGNPDASAVLPGGLRYGSPAFLLYKGNSIAKSFGLVNPVDAGQHSLTLALLGRPAFLCLMLANMLAVSTLLYIIVRAARPGLHGWQTRPLWTATLIAFSVYLVLPQTLLGISDPGSRVLQTLLCLAVFFSPGPPVAWRAAAAFSGLLACSGVILYAELAGNPPRTSEQPRLPAPFELLSKAPYAYGYDRYTDLEHGRMNQPVFPTALFTNQSSLPPPQK